MTSLALSYQEPSTLRNIEGRGVRGGNFKGQPPNVRNVPKVSQDTRKKIEIAQMRRTI
jgi:hypothetical protein